MNKNDNSENSSDYGLALLAIVFCGYAVYKALTTSSNQESSTPSKKRLSSSMVYDIVSSNLRTFDDIDMGRLAMYFALPDFFMGSLKNDIYHDMMLMRINRIYKTLISFKGEYEGFYPSLSERDINNLISFIQNDCYEEIKDRKFFASIKGMVIGKLPVPGSGLVSKATSAKMEYHILQSITKGLQVFFVTLFVYGGSIDDAKMHLLHRYVDCFKNSVDII